MAKRGRKPKLTPTITAKGYKLVRDPARGMWRGEHVMVAERALGKPLPEGCHVHHVDEDLGNNTPSNLVICPSAAYHVLLHRRTLALKVSGSANKVQCRSCGAWAFPPKDNEQPHFWCLKRKDARQTVKKLCLWNVWQVPVVRPIPIPASWRTKEGG